MAMVKSFYICHCTVPTPLEHVGEDSGLCSSCGLIYDERLYGNRLRKYVPAFNYESVDEFLTKVDPGYSPT